VAQKYKPVIVNGKPEMRADKLLGFWVRYDEHTAELAELSNSFSVNKQQAEGTFFDELDRLEKANKELHARVKELEG